MLRVAYATPSTRTVPWCDTCQLRQTCGGEDFLPGDLAFMATFKVVHERVWEGTELLRENHPIPLLLTLYSGWAFRSRMLPSGERQILSVLLPGDLIGIETLFPGPQGQSVEAATDVTFCVFDSKRFDELLSRKTLAKRLLTLLTLDQQQLCDRLTIIGTCDAPRNLAHFVCDLYDRLQSRRMVQGLRFRLPLTARRLADACGLTTVHLHRTLRHLREQGVFRFEAGWVEIQDLARLRALSPLNRPASEAQPII